MSFHHFLFFDFFSDANFCLLQGLGRYFDDMPPLPSAGVVEEAVAGEKVGTSQSGGQGRVVLLGISLNELGLQFAPYVSIPMP